MNKKKWIATFELLFATAVWGFGFTATVWVLKYLDVVTLSVFRFFAAFTIGQSILFLKPFRKFNSKKMFIDSALPGLALGAMLVCQTWGLEYTSVTNSGFITTLYAVFVPLVELAILKHFIGRLHFVWVLVALAGTALMVNLQIGDFNKGDALTFVCAFLGALQIVWVGLIAHRIQSSLVFNFYQCFWAGVVSLAFFPVYGKTYYSIPDGHAFWGLVCLVLGSTIIAFALQIKSQKVLTPATASLVYLLESPFAAFFAVLLLNEKISSLQLLGGFLILLSAYGAVTTSKLKPHKAST